MENMNENFLAVSWSFANYLDSYQIGEVRNIIISIKKMRDRQIKFLEK